MQNSTKAKNFEKQKKLKQMEKKKEIQKWKSTKAVKERADKLEKEILSLREKEKKTSLANKLIREYQCQDNYYISRRLSKLRINVSAPSVPTLKTNYCKVDRDPERIFKATQQWVNRITPEDTGSSDNIFARNVSVKRIPKLYVFNSIFYIVDFSNFIVISEPYPNGGKLLLKTEIFIYFMTAFNYNITYCTFIFYILYLITIKILIYKCKY